MAKKTTRKKTPGSKPIRENHCPVPNGTLLVIGGSENKGEEGPDEKRRSKNFTKLEVLQKFNDLLGKKDAVVGIVTTATSEAAESFEDYKKAFKEVGITRLRHINHKERRELLDDKKLIA